MTAVEEIDKELTQTTEEATRLLKVRAFTERELEPLIERFLRLAKDVRQSHDSLHDEWSRDPSTYNEESHKILKGLDDKQLACASLLHQATHWVRNHSVDVLGSGELSTVYLGLLQSRFCDLHDELPDKLGDLAEKALAEYESEQPKD